MKDRDKSKDQLIQELQQLRNQISFQSNDRDLLFKTLADNYPHSYLSVINKNLTVGYTTGREFKKQGLDPNQFIGLSVEEIFQPFGKEIVNTVIENYKNAFAGNEVEFEIYIRNEYQHYHVVPLIKNDSNSIDQILSVVENISDRRNHEESLKAHIRANPDIIIILDRSGTYREVYTNTPELLIHKQEYMIGKKVKDVVNSEIGDKVSQAMEALDRGESIAEFTYTINVLAGERHFKARMVNTANQLYMTIISDVTKSVQLEAQLRQSQKMEDIGVLTGGMTHEFNNLLSPILGYSDLILYNKDPSHPDYRALVQIREAANKARELIRQLLAYSRKSHSQKKEIQLTTVIHDALKLLKTSIPSNITIEKKLESNLPLILAMPVEINQVIMNLCINAYQAMPDGGSIIISARNVGFKSFVSPTAKQLEGNYLELSIEDNGAGIEPDHLDKIFDPFFTTKEVGKGSGLGLSVVHGIVLQHQGHMQVTSTPGQGTGFTIYLPVSNLKLPQSDIPKKSQLQGAEKILLVDDEEMIIVLASDILDKFGYQVETFLSAKKAIEHFKEHYNKYDLVITDYGMPDIDGKKLINAVRKIRPDISIVLTTGYGDFVAQGDFDSWGVDELVIKPFTVEVFAQAVRKALQRNL